MKSPFQRLVTMVAVAALAVVPLSKVEAQGNANIKPVVVVSIADIDEQYADINYALRAAGAGIFALFLPPQEQIGEAIDVKKPMGAYLTMDDGVPAFVGFVGMKDLDRALELIENNIDGTDDVGDGVTKITSLDGQEVFVKEVGGWAFVSNVKSNLAKVPENPAGILGGLNKKYNLAVQVNAANVPDDLKQMAIGAMKEGYEQALEQGLRGQGADLRNLTEKIGASSLESIEQLVTETDQLTIGWAIDAVEKGTYIDITLTAREGTKLAEQLELNKDIKTEHAGFLIPGAAMQANIASHMSMDDIATLALAVKELRDNAMAELKKDSNLNAEEQAAASEILSDLFDVAGDTILTGKCDLGAVVLLNEDALTFATGGTIADGAKLEKAMKRLVEMAKNEPGFPGVKMNADTHKGVTFHTTAIPLPRHEEEARQLFGDSLEVAVGVGPKSAYLAVGKNALGTVKKIIDKSAEGPAADAAPIHLQIALKPIVQFAAAVSGDDTAVALAASLDEVESESTISITSKSIPRGGMTRLMLDEGVLKLIGVAGQAAAKQFGGGI